MSSDQDPDDDPEEPFIPLGSEELPENPPAEETFNAHTAIARSLYPNIPRVMRKEARSFFDGAMYAYTEGDLAGARLSFLAVAAIGDPDTAPAAMVFLGVIAFRRRDESEARMWFSRAASGPDGHWALVATQELRRLG
jgi:TolA-binding protein